MRYDNIPYPIIQEFGNNPIKSSGENELVYYCPKCEELHGSPDTKGKLYVSTKDLVYHCFRCGYSGRLGKEVNNDRYYEEDKEKDVEELISNVNEVLNEDNNKYPLTIPIDKVTTSESATKYLLDRGFTYEQMEYYDMRVGNLAQEFGRIVIPNEVNRLVYTDFYSARSYIGQVPKYHNPCAKKSSVVFNLHNIEESSPIIIVEGALTAVAAGYHAVATLGKTITKDQVSLIAQKHPSVIYLNYDYGAEEFSHNACELIHKMIPNVPLYEVLMKDDRDAADLSHEEYAQCLQQAKLYNPLLNGIEEILNV